MFPSMFCSLKSSQFNVLHLNIWSILIFVYKSWDLDPSAFVLAYGYLVITVVFVEKAVFPSINCFYVFVKNQVGCQSWWYIWWCLLISDLGNRGSRIAGLKASLGNLEAVSKRELGMKLSGKVSGLWVQSPVPLPPNQVGIFVWIYFWLLWFSFILLCPLW